MIWNYVFKRNLAGLDGSRERAAIEFLRDWNATEYLTFPCVVGIVGLVFANGIEVRISCKNRGEGALGNDQEQNQYYNVRPHIRSPSPFTRDHFL